MAVEIFKLFGSIFVNNDEANKSIAETEKKAKSTHGTFASGVSTIAKWGAAVGATALTVGSAAATVASNYETSFAKVSTLLTGNESEIAKYKKDIINVSNETGLATDEMSESVYSAISAGVDQADAIGFTTDALKLAKGGFTETATAVDVLSTAINAYGLESDQASKISDILITTQNLGKTTVDELAGSMGKVIPLASAYGVNMENLGATYATLTAGGIATAEAITYTKSMMSELAKEGSTVSSVLKDKTGKSFSELMNSGSSMGDVLQILSDSVDGDSTAFANLWSSTEAGTGALAIVNSGADAFNETLKSMQDSSGATESAYGKMADTLESRINKLKTNGQNMMTSLGESILPIIEDVCDEIIDNIPKIQGFVESLIPIFEDFFSAVMPALMDICEQILPVLMELLGELMPVFSELMETLAPIIVQIVEQLFPPLLQIIQDLLPYFMQVIQAIMPLFSTLVELLMPVIEMFIQLASVLLDGLLAALTPIIEDLATFLNDLLTPLIPIISDLCDTIIETLQPVFEQLSPVITQIFDALRPVIDLLGEMFETLIPALVPVIEWLAEAFSDTLGWAIEGVSDIIDDLSGVFSGLVDFIKGVFSGDWEQAWNGIVQVFKNVFNILPTIVENIINGVIGVINGLLSGINWATSMIGWEIDPIPEVTLPRFRAGIDYVPHDKYAAYLDAGEAVLTAQEAEEYRQSKREGRGSVFENDSTNIVNNISINIPSVAINNDMDVDSFVDDMSNRLADEVTRRQKAYA